MFCPEGFGVTEGMVLGFVLGVRRHCEDWFLNQSVGVSEVGGVAAFDSQEEVGVLASEKIVPIRPLNLLRSFCYF